MKTVLIYSGGLDSTCLLIKLLSECKGIGDQVKTVSFDYGQRHRKELIAAREISHMLGVEHRIVDLYHLRTMLSGSSQTDPTIPVPEGHYAEENMKLTVVPNRNMIMLSIAIGWAAAMHFNKVAFAAHSGDHAIYPDCRPEFLGAVDRCAFFASWESHVNVIAPFIYLNKGQCIKAIEPLNALREEVIKKTWSCYKGEEIHCGKCGACTERKEAFQIAGVTDPTIYEN